MDLEWNRIVFSDEDVVKGIKLDFAQNLKHDFPGELEINVIVLKFEEKELVQEEM